MPTGIISYLGISITIPSVPFTLAMPSLWAHCGAPAEIVLLGDATPPAVTAAHGSATAAFQTLADMINQLVTVTGQAQLTSSSSAALNSGSVSLTVNLDASASPLTVGDRIRIAAVTAPGDYMEGAITAYSGTTLTVNVDAVHGQGTFVNWNIGIAGGAVFPEEFLRYLLGQAGVTYALPQTDADKSAFTQLSQGFRYWITNGMKEMPSMSAHATKRPDGTVVLS